MTAVVDITGNKYGRLTAIKPATGTKWECLCVCGKTTYVHKGSLTRGVSKSCGCFRREHTSSKNTRHGRSDTKAYNSWQGMKARCLNTKLESYPNYGGRGITVCERWLDSFENFLADMGEPDKDASLDRIDVNGNYEPSNCRWANTKQQSNNRRNSIWVEGFSLAMIAKELDIPYTTLYTRLMKSKYK